MASSPEEIRKHIKTYWMVGAALCVFTCITLALGIWKPLDFGYPGVGPVDIIIGLAVAATKTSLVMLIFMHLNHERGLIYKFLLFTLAFVVSLMGLSLFAKANPIPVHSRVIVEVDHDREKDRIASGEPNPYLADHPKEGQKEHAEKKDTSH